MERRSFANVWDALEDTPAEAASMTMRSNLLLLEERARHFHLTLATFRARRPDPDDGRASRIMLTRAGRRTIERVLEARREWYDHLVADWDDAELATFATLLGRVAASLERDVEDARDD